MKSHIPISTKNLVLGFILSLLAPFITIEINHFSQKDNIIQSEKEVKAHGDTLHAERYYMEKDLQDSLNTLLELIRSK